MGKALIGRVVAITGAGDGIGRACAQRYAAEGATVIINDRNVERLEETQKEIQGSGGTAAAAPGDITDRAVIDSIVATAIREFGRLDVMHNNAGGSTPYHFHEVPEDRYRRLMALNLDAYFFGCQAAIKVMLDQPQRGVILNTASVMGVRGNSMTSTYSAAKAGVINLTRALSIEYGTMGIRVNAIVPGSIATAGNLRAWTKYPEEMKQQMEAQLAMGRQGTPEEVANVALFLASDQASYVTGAVIPVDGGQTAKLAGPQLKLD